MLLFHGPDVLAAAVARASGRDVVGGHPVAVCVAAIVVVLASSAVTTMALAGRFGLGNVDIPFYLALTTLMLRWSRDSWRQFTSLDRALEDLVSDPGERLRAARLVAARLGTRPQLTVGGAGALLGLLCGLLSMRASHDTVATDLPYLTATVVTGAVGGSVVYWLWAGVTFLAQLSGLGSLVLHGEHEGHPLLRSIYGIVAQARTRVAVGLVLAEVPLLVLAHSAPQSRVLLGAVIGVSLLCFATLAATGLGPDVFIGRVVRTSQNAEIAALIRRRQDLVVRDDLEAFHADCDLRRTIAAIRSRPIRRVSGSSFANVAAATVTALIPIVALLVKYRVRI